MFIEIQSLRKFLMGLENKLLKFWPVYLDIFLFIVHSGTESINNEYNIV